MIAWGSGWGMSCSWCGCKGSFQGGEGTRVEACAGEDLAEINSGEGWFRKFWVVGAKERMCLGLSSLPSLPTSSWQLLMSLPSTPTSWCTPVVPLPWNTSLTNSFPTPYHPLNSLSKLHSLSSPTTISPLT
jgi:hypothetical protein